MHCPLCGVEYEFLHICGGRADSESSGTISIVDEKGAVYRTTSPNNDIYMMCDNCGDLKRKEFLTPIQVETTEEESRCGIPEMRVVYICKTCKKLADIENDLEEEG